MMRAPMLLTPAAILVALLAGCQPAAPPAPAMAPPTPEVSFCGVASPGWRVCYVVSNCSEIIDRWPQLQAELARSIRALTPTQRFHVILWSEGDPAELHFGSSGPTMQPANAVARDAAARWIDRQPVHTLLSAHDPAPAVRRAFAVDGGPPDVIYFLTDAHIPPDLVALFDELNTPRRVRVNTIAFQGRWGEELLRRIASASGGQHRYVSPQDLDAARPKP
ncbi:MAG: hypothetical protein BIFFINMI_01822 [Phycisphaerae bacterium]|nr:hypothetical protein [Phycisphaerae bacterium]